jgi:hypothetical protein
MLITLQVSPPKAEPAKSLKESLFNASRAKLSGVSSSKQLAPPTPAAAAATVHPDWEGGSIVVEPQANNNETDFFVCKPWQFI